MPKIALAVAVALVLEMPEVSAGNATAVCPASVQGERAAVGTASAAIETAKPELMRRFSPEHIARYEPYTAKLEGGVWHVQGHLPSHMLGGTPEAKVCRFTGQVLSVFHTQ